MTENQEKKLQKELGTSPGGSTLYAYDDKENTGWRTPSAYTVYTEEITKHFEMLFPDRESLVFHEMISDFVHIDVNVLKATAENNFHVMYTTGMSDLPMTLPESIRERTDLEHAELFMFLPASWNFGGTGTLTSDLPFEDAWPIELFKYLARFPHEYQTWLGWGHTIPNGADYEPFLEGSEMCGVVLLEFGKNFSPMVAEDGTSIHFYMVMPVTRDEMEYKLEQGMTALDKLFEKYDLPMIMDMYRESVVKKDGK